MTALFKQLGVGVPAELQEITDKAGEDAAKNVGNGAGDGSGEILEGVPNVALLGGAALAALLLLK